MLSNLIDYIPLLITLITIITGFITWGLNERSKRKQEGYKRKEEHYTELIKSLKGFYVNSNNKDLKEVFLEQVNLCWMYCPDDVVIKIYDFWKQLIQIQMLLTSKKIKHLAKLW